MTEVANSKLAGIIDAVKGLSVIELADLVKALEKEFGVSAAAVAVQGGGAAPAAAVEAPTSFTVTMVEIPAEKKIQGIKLIREILGLGLADAKGFVESLPKVVKDGLEKPAADELSKKLQDAGAKVKVEGA
ncbi:MAG: 50S ribosomal protein L7/L12 [Planctomycetes bacterium]|jgi:large subunit ribosomal protein L7/L12|nr:50S ribosomal protein L7/L12 [Planctomycetota bacterium]